VADTYSVGASLNLPVGAWQLAWTNDASHVNTTTTIRHAAADLSGLQTLVNQGDALALRHAAGGRDPAHPARRSPAASPIPRPRSPPSPARRCACPGGQTALTLKAGFAYNGLR
jgi:hypothetical protein